MQTIDIPGPLKILILEDSTSDADLLQYHLKKAGLHFEARIVDTKNEFTEALSSFLPDVILSDHTLPQFNSMDALRIFKTSQRKIPFILVTGSVSEEFAVKSIHEGADDYILKDRLARLPDAITNALEKHRLEIERQKYINDVIANEALFIEAEQIAHFGILEVDLENDITKWSDETFRILGYNPGEVEPSMKTFFGNIHPDDLKRVKSLVECIPSIPDSLKMNFRINDKNGSIRYVSSEWLIKHDAEKGAIRITGFNQDITEIKIAEQSLKKSEANLRTIFDNTEISYLFLTTDLNIVSFNQPAYKLSQIHMSKPLAEGKNFTEYFPDDKKIKIQNRYSKALSGEHLNFDTTFPNKDDSPSWYKIQVLPVSDSGKKIHGLIIMATDITEQKKSEIHRNKITAELIHRNKDLEQFTYIISHNLRVPVANILGLSDALNDENLKPAEMTEIARALHNSTGKLDNVILDLNHILQVKKPLSEKTEKINFSHLVHDILAGQDGLEMQEIEIRTDFNSVNEIVFLKSYLYSIFYNLISNSIKYRRPEVPCVVGIKSEKTESGIRLTFRDNGMGLNLEKIGSHLFGLYKRFHSNIKGKGMGLFMVKTQVEALGGRISVSSEINTGTEFIIDFPSIP